MSVYKDNYFESILEKLNGKLDPDLFEKCVVDILRKNDYPTLVPIPGGQDAGMDGAISGTNGAPMPLVTTTHKTSSIGNLTKNLTQYKTTGGKRRDAVFATSVSLTARKINNLYKRAEELGFNLVQVYEQEALAMRLYHEPSWCNSLLGLTGMPRSLSKIPINSRSVINDNLIGREFEKEQLLKAVVQSRDTILLGQPGIGKTFLLADLVQNTNAFFLNNDDKERIYNDIRELKPDVIIIDDAHIKTQLLQELILFRKEHSISFSFICVTWPCFKDQLLSELELAEDSCLELRLLSRNDIVNIINDGGIGGPKNLVWHLVNQSSGKPGLSAMLTKVCLSGGIDDFISGNALKRILLSSVKKHFGDEVIPVLAHFSFMGDSGASFQEVSKWINIDLMKLHRLTSDLALTGILVEVKDRKLAVIPEELRFTLVRDSFFSGAVAFCSEFFFELAKENKSIVKVLIGVLSKGGEVNEDDVYRLVLLHRSENILELYAGLGRKQVLNLLKDCPEEIEHYLGASLFYAAKETVPYLLEQAIQNPIANLNSHPEHPVRRLQSWISKESGSKGVIENRKILLDAILDRIDSSENVEMLYELVPSIFSPSWSENESDPGSGMTITMYNGLYSESEISEINNLWTQFNSKIKTCKNIKWKYLFSIINKFLYLHVPNVKVSKKTQSLCRDVAKQIIDDLYSLGQKHHGVCLKLSSVCKQIRYKKNIKVDAEFEVLFPKESFRKDYKNVERKYLKDAAGLAARYLRRSPKTTLSKLKLFSEFAQDVEKTYPNLTFYFLKLVLEKQINLVKWFQCAVELEINASLLGGIVPKALENSAGELEAQIVSLLDGNYYWMLASTILSSKFSSDGLVDEVIKRLDKSHSQLIEHLLYRAIPSATSLKLLTHDCAEIKEAAAIGEYLRGGEERGSIRAELKEAWENAVVTIKDDEYWIQKILSSNSDLAYRWLKERVHEEDYLGYHERKTFSVAMKVIEKEHKVELLKSLKSHYSSIDKVRKLVGNDPDCFQALLDNANLKSLHLVPLEKKTGEILISFCLKAINAGYSNEDVSDNIRSRSDSWSGKESVMLLGKINTYKESLKLTDNPDIIEVINEVVARYESRRAYVLEKEHEEEVYGRF